MRGGGFRCENVFHQGVGIFDPFSNKFFFLLSVKRKKNIPLSIYHTSFIFQALLPYKIMSMLVQYSIVDEKYQLESSHIHVCILERQSRIQ